MPSSVPGMAEDMKAYNIVPVLKKVFQDWHLPSWKIQNIY